MDSTSARRLLLPNSSPPATFTTANPTESSRFDAKVIMIVSVVLCALIFSLILNSIIRCAFKCFHPVPATAADQLSGEAKLANTGIKKRALKTFPVVTFSDGLDLDAECVICLSEFAGDDRVKILPLCNHGFHVECIDQWLGSHSSCPTCRHSVVETCRKSVAPIVAAAAAAAEEVVVSMPVVEAEGPVGEHWMIRSVFFWRKN